MILRTPAKTYLKQYLSGLEKTGRGPDGKKKVGKAAPKANKSVQRRTTKQAAKR